MDTQELECCIRDYS